MDLIQNNCASLISGFGQPLTSVHDVDKNSAENFYHGLMLGFTASLSSQYEIRSNRESGYGRYDMLLIPKSADKSGALLEFKYLKPQSKTTLITSEQLKEAAQKALQQIHTQHYDAELNQRGIKTLYRIGLAFSGKRVQIAY